MTEVGSYTHTEAMDLIREANTVTILRYEEAIAIYLRARGVLEDGADMLGDLIPLDWNPKEEIRRLRETIDRKQAAKLLLQKEAAELRQKKERAREVLQKAYDELAAYSCDQELVDLVKATLDSDCTLSLVTGNCSFGNASD